ncbi:MAG: [FeFe] hydrogenase H-cluster maturation GTPase HydF [Defluviitaleaceae bacterium]|nr:[FeFe] hydrogenase H-cluster maturation GTPase HydF [Defluviitaleaceae bacterium]
MNITPRGERLHIGIFGKRNAGKSSLLNAITGQNAAVVSSVKGTTTDPVYKAMELLPIGPVVFIDTAGIDDDSEIGSLRVEKSKKILRKTDVALLVIDAVEGLDDSDRELINAFEDMSVKYLIVYNKSDLAKVAEYEGLSGISVSCVTGANIRELREKIAKISQGQESERRLVSDLIQAGDIVVLVIPIDSSAPKGRLILPQQQVIRDALDVGAICVVAQPQELADTFAKLTNPPKLVITDSQVFAEVSRQIPENIGLTSFSILMARYKGVLDSAIQCAKIIDTIKNGDKILISEGCTHHRQCDDIGTVKIPRWIEQHTGAKPAYTFSSGSDFPSDLSVFKLIIHCGGCMQNRREMQSRQSIAKTENVPMTNFGIAISHMQGILKRCVAPFC